MKLALLTIISALSLFGQCQIYPSNANRYIAVKETSLTSAAEKVTVQQPGTATPSNTVQFECADIRCSVACEVFVYQNGTAATATTLAVTPISQSKNPTAVAFSGSNVGGSAIKAYYIEAAGTLVLDIHNIVLPRGASGAANFSIGTSSITGTARIQIQWVETGNGDN